MKKSYQEQSPFKELVTTAKQHRKVVIDVNTQNYSLRQIGRKNDSNESFTAIKGLFPLFSINLFWVSWMRFQIFEATLSPLYIPHTNMGWDP